MTPALEVEQLRYRYPRSAAPTVEGLHFAIQPGESLGLLGPSGAGKSTTLKIIIGLLKGYEGSVRVLGREARKANADFYERIGVAFEFPNFYGRFTALENLMQFRSLYKGLTEDPLALLAQLGLSEAAEQKVATFSKGMKMRLNFARALMNKPHMLLLDEPTSGLDPVHAQRMKDMIAARKKEGAAILITTHNMHTAEQLCDRVAFMIDGRIPVIDSPRALKLNYGSRTVKVEYAAGEGRSAEQFPLENLGGQERFLELIRRERIETIHSQEATLEQIFIAVTGKKLGTADTEESA